MKNTVIGVFDSRENASAAIISLKGAGINNESISVVTRDTEELKTWRESESANVVEDTAKGALAGGAVGGLVGLLVGVGVLVLPPLGGIIVAGPIAAALGISTAGASTLAGAGIGAAGGGIVGALTNLGLSNEDAEMYQKMITNNEILIAVDISEDELSVDDVINTFRENGADEVRQTSSKNSFGE